MAQLDFYINGQKVSPPKNWRSLGVRATWINGSIQPALANDDMVWVNDAAELIRQHILDGNIFKALPLKIVATDPIDGISDTYEGYLDTATKFSNVRNASEIVTGVYRPEDLELVNKKLEALSFGYLADHRVILKKDYVTIMRMIHRTDVDIDTLFVAYGVYVVGRELFVVTKNLITTASDLAATPAATIAAPAFIIKTVANILLAALEIAFLILALVRLISQVLDIVGGRIGKIQGMKVKTMLEKSLGYIGLELKTNISELDSLTFIPSKSDWNKKKKDGLPQSGDYGYKCSELMNMVLELFNAQVTVVGKELYLYAEGDKFWERQAKYTLPDVFREVYDYNTEEAVKVRYFTFATDASDDYTVDNFTGTNCQINLINKTTTTLNDNLLKGLKETRFPVALGTTAREAGAMEQPLLQVVTKIAEVLKKFGSNGLSKKVEILSTALCTSQKYFNVPKLVMVNGLGLNANHRKLFSAKVLYEKYHGYNSIGRGTGQKAIYNNITVPFGLKHFKELTETNHFLTTSGERGQIQDLVWTMADDKAKIDFFIREIYTDKLSEEIIEG